MELAAYTPYKKSDNTFCIPLVCDEASRRMNPKKGNTHPRPPLVVCIIIKHVARTLKKKLRNYQVLEKYLLETRVPIARGVARETEACTSRQPTEDL